MKIMRWMQVWMPVGVSECRENRFVSRKMTQTTNLLKLIDEHLSHWLWARKVEETEENNVSPKIFYCFVTTLCYLSAWKNTVGVFDSVTVHLIASCTSWEIHLLFIILKMRAYHLPFATIRFIFLKIILSIIFKLESCSVKITFYQTPKVYLSF